MKVVRGQPFSLDMISNSFMRPIGTLTDQSFRGPSMNFILGSSDLGI